MTWIGRSARVGLALGLCAPVLAASPPGPDALTELSAGQWGAQAQSASATVADDTTRFVAGSASLKFETDGGFDTWLWAPVGQDAAWDLLLGGRGGLSFQVYAENPNLGFQNSSPWIRLCTTATDYFEYRPDSELLNDARGQWLRIEVPYNGGRDWSVNVTGQPDLRNVAWLEIHADTWGAGFALWIDDLRFDLPLPPPTGQRAYAYNHRVRLFWNAYDGLFGPLDHYAIYRATTPFSDTTGMTPIATLSDPLATQYDDGTAVNGVSYYYAVTIVLLGGGESTRVQAIGPRTPRDETDLQVVSIARTPRYPRYLPTYTQYTITEPSGFGPYIFSAATGLGGGQEPNTPRWPEPGDPVTYTATVRNRGTNIWVGTLGGTWRLDGQVVDQPGRGVSLEPDDTTTFSVVIPWDGASHTVEFTLDISDDRATNNRRAIDTKSVAFLSFVDRTYYEDFREETSQYPAAATDDFLDWLNRHMDRFNQMFADAGCAKRVHFDVLEILADEAPDPAIDRVDFAIFPFRYRAGEGTLRHSGYWDPAEDIDFGLLHEMGHQLGLIDLYRLDLPAERNEVSASSYFTVPGLMHGVSHFLSQHSANAMNHWLDVAHGYYGQYMYNMPETICLRVLGSDGQPLSGAHIRMYQMVERPGQGQVITDQVKAQGTTGPDGLWTLPNVPIDPALVPPALTGDTLHDNPFGYLAVVGTNGLLLFRIEKDSFVDYAWLDITEVNNAWFAGQTQTAVFDRQVAIGGPVEYYPPADMTEMNAGRWTAWAEQGSISLADDTSRVQAGAASLRIEATGGFDNAVRYPGDHLASWDLSGVEWIRMWCYAENPNIGFQNHSPWVRLADANGFIELRPSSDVLNTAIGRWRRFDIPLAGGGGWQRTVSGSPDLTAIHAIEIHADTWGAGFTLWIDGLTFDPRPCPGDVNLDGQIDLADLATLLSHFGLTAVEPADGDLDHDGDVDLRDLADLLAAFGTSCSG